MKKKLEEAIKSADVAEVRNILLEMVTSKGGNISTIEDMAEAISKTDNLFDKDDGKIYAPTAKDLTVTQIEALREDVKGNFSIPKFRMLAEVQEIERTHPSYFKNRVKDVVESYDFADGSKVKVDEHMVDNDVVTMEASEETPADTTTGYEYTEINEPQFGREAEEKTELKSAAITEAGADTSENATENSYENTTENSYENTAENAADYAADYADETVDETADETADVNTADYADENTTEVYTNADRKRVSAGKCVGYILLILGLAASIVGVCVPVKFLIGVGIGVMMLAAATIYFAINNMND